MRKLDYESLSDADLQQILERSAANFESGVNHRAPAKRSSLVAWLLPRFFRPRGVEHGGSMARLAELGGTALSAVAHRASVGSRSVRPTLVAASSWLASFAAGVVIRCRDAVRASRSPRRRESKLPAPPHP